MRAVAASRGNGTPDAARESLVGSGRCPGCGNEGVHALPNEMYSMQRVCFSDTGFLKNGEPLAVNP